MGLASALSTALTGLTAAEATIDVVGNNLANSNTVGFKSSSASFSTQFLQTQTLGSTPTANSGGTNPRQVGLGTMVSEITPDFSQGTLEISANPTDLAIQGNGFFMVEGGVGQTLFTRNGIFKFNAENEMVTITGNRLLGFGIDEDFTIQRTTLEPISIPLGAAAVAQPTANAIVEGTLRPNGDVATTAQQIQTGILGTNFYSAPATQATTAQSTAPAVAAAGTSGTSAAGGGMTAGATYQYKFVWADGSYTPPPPAQPPALTESAPSDVLTATVNAGEGSINLTNIPATPPSSAYDFVRIYRRETTGPTAFNYINEIPVAAGTYLDTMDDATASARPTLDETLLSGNYSYYVTFASTAGGPGAGLESRPSPISNPINVSNGRVLLSGLPTTDPANPKDATWKVRRVYRNLSTDDSTFHYIGEIPDTTSAINFSDNLADSVISGNATIDLDGEKIQPPTLLTDVLSRNGSNYTQVFQAGTLEFTGKKGGRTLAMKEFTIDSTTTVQQLIDFMDQSMGIQATTADPINPVPQDTPSGTNPGGTVVGGRIVMTGNNGVDNAIDIALSGMILKTSSGTQNLNLPWGTKQTAVGESAVTDFIVYDSLGIPLRVRLTAVLEERDSTSTTYRWFADSADNDPVSGAEIAVGTGRVTFDGEGNITNVSEATVAIDRQNVSSASPLEVEVDFSNVSGLSGDASSLSVSRQDGSGPGVLTSFIVGEDGIIRGVFSNGVTRDLGQIRLARFANPAGLEQKGQNLYAEGVNSGLPVTGDPGQQGIGTVVAGAVELSNTDIGSNLIDLILASTMYRGNTRVITTAQQMIDELLALRR